jgi:hypothetical protein
VPPWMVTSKESLDHSSQLMGTPLPIRVEAKEPVTEPSGIRVTLSEIVPLGLRWAAGRGSGIGGFLRGMVLPSWGQTR